MQFHIHVEFALIFPYFIGLKFAPMQFILDIVNWFGL
jgi:hypothetical protein